MGIFTLAQKAGKAGYRVSGFSTLGSTNEVAMQAAREGSANHLWVASLAQTSGRGRRGRHWQSETGNLAASLVVVLPEEIVDPGLVGFVAALALLRALGNVASRCDPDNLAPLFEVKWPNDVLANGAKLAGILLEAERLNTGEMAIVAGIGVNVNSAPRDLPYRASSLAELGIDIKAQDLFTALSAAWVDVFAIWNNGAGREQILNEWRANASGMGNPVTVKRSRDEVRGIFESIDSQGQLVVRHKSGQTTIITAGDVFFNHI